MSKFVYKVDYTCTDNELELFVNEYKVLSEYCDGYLLNECGADFVDDKECYFNTKKEAIGKEMKAISDVIRLYESRIKEQRLIHEKLKRLLEAS